MQLCKCEGKYQQCSTYEAPRNVVPVRAFSKATGTACTILQLAELGAIGPLLLEVAFAGLEVGALRAGNRGTGVLLQMGYDGTQ